MAVRFVLGRAGAGKTRYCIDAALAELDADAPRLPGEADRRLLLIVPEQASFQTEKALASRSARRGYWRAEVLTFSRLAQRVVEDAGRPVEFLSRGARRLALRRLVATDPERLSAFGAAVRTPGFLSHLDRFVDELLGEEISPETLLGSAERLSETAARQRVEQLARLYAAYLEWVGPQRLDPRQKLTHLRDCIAGAAWLRGASVRVDGFSSFSAQEAAALVAMAQVAREVHVTLLPAPDAPLPAALGAVDPLLLFRRTRQTQARLVHLFTQAGVELLEPLRLRASPPPRFAARPQLARLEAGLARLGSEDSRTGAARDHAGTLETPAAQATGDAREPGVRIMSCATRREELRQAARDIRTRIITAQGRLRFRDFAVITRDLAPIAGLVAEVFDDYEIPYFLDRRLPLAAHALPRCVLALLEAVAGDFPPEAMLDLIGTELLPLPRSHCWSLDLLLNRHALRGFERWRQPRWEFPAGRGRPWTEPEHQADRRRRLVADLAPLVALARRVRTPTGGEWARALYESLTRLRVPNRLSGWIRAARREQRWQSAEAHRQAWQRLIDVLDDVEQTLSDERLELDDLLSLLRPALAEQTLATPPPTLDRVLVSEIERSRHPDIKYAWLIGFNDGVFPAAPPDDPLLSAAERRALCETGVVPLATRADESFDERLLAYIAMTRPSHGLTISFSRVDPAGEEAWPSPLLGDVLAVLPEATIEQPPEAPPPVCINEAARDLLAARDAQLDDLLAARYHPLQTQLERDAARGPRLARALRGLAYDNRPSPVGNLCPSPLPPGVAWRGSPSRLETFLQCPFKYFARYGLGLESQRDPPPAAMELGTLAHELLAEAVGAVLRAGRDVAAVSDGEWIELLRAAARARPSPVRPERAFMARMQARLAEQALLAQAARWRRGTLRPIAVEQVFNDAEPGGWPELALRLADGRRIRVEGKIDRVDAAATQAGELLLISDYKPRVSSPGSMRSPVLTQVRFQLFTYLLAACEARRAGGVEVVAAGVLVTPLAPNIAALDTQLAGSSSAEDQHMHMFLPRGLFAEGIGDALDTGRPPRSPVAQIARRRDGCFDARGDARPRHEIERRLDLARRTILQAAEGIAAGVIDVAPLLEKRTLACRQCEHRSVCRFERFVNAPRRAERHLPVLDADEPAAPDADEPAALDSEAD